MKKTTNDFEDFNKNVKKKRVDIKIALENIKNKTLDIIDKNVKIKPLTEKIDFLIRNKNKMDRDWIDNIWEAVAIPERSIEVESWALRNKGKVLLLRGKRHKETLLHWGVMSTLSLMIALVECNLNVNEKDKYGKTPFDWLMERYNIVFVSKEQKIDENGMIRLKAETQSNSIYFWNLGGRPSSSLEEIKEGKNLQILTNMANGELWLIKLFYMTYGKEILKGWLNDRRSLIHIWSLSPKSPTKRQGFEALMSHLKLSENILKDAIDEKILSIDEVDINERTALWYSVDGLFSSNEHDELLFDNIEILLDLGANFNKKDLFDTSPYDIVLKHIDTDKGVKIKKIFDDFNQNRGNNV